MANNDPKRFVGKVTRENTDLGPRYAFPGLDAGASKRGDVKSPSDQPMKPKTKGK